MLGEQSPECGDISSMSRLMGHEVLPREDTTAMESPGDGTGIHACLRNRILGARPPLGYQSAFCIWELGRQGP